MTPPGAAADSARSHLPTLTCCLLGALVSLYAYHVEYSAHNEPDYTALCDISERISCTKVVASRYGKGFGIVGLVLGEDSIFNLPNCLIGLAFYSLQVLLEYRSTRSAAKVQTMSSVAANLGSIYLASLLYWVVQSFCLICVTVYLINAFLLYCNWGRLTSFPPGQPQKKPQWKRD